MDPAGQTLSRMYRRHPNRQDKVHLPPAPEVEGAGVSSLLHGDSTLDPFLNSAFISTS